MPVTLRSRKSASVRDGVLLMAKSNCIPTVADAKNIRLLPAVPVVESVPLIVWFAANVTFLYPTTEEPVTDRLLNVFAPVIIIVVPDVPGAPVKATL